MSSPSIKEFLPILLLLLLINFCQLTYGISCSSGTILCRNGDKCVNIGYICDGDNDCGDLSDENFCDEWRNTGCSTRGQASCTRDGSTTCISMENYCAAKHPPCSGRVDPRICKMLADRKLQRLSDITTEAPTTIPTTAPTTPSPPPPPISNLEESEIRGAMLEDNIQSTMHHPECPQLYTLIGNHCLSLFYILKLGWGEARKFCETISGELVSFSENPIDFINLLKHLRESKITTDFWVGGRYANDTMGWMWINDDAMELGSPFWAVRYKSICEGRPDVIDGDTYVGYGNHSCFNYLQSPGPNTYNLCAAVTFEHYYYITDEDCMSRKSPLCLYNNDSPISNMSTKSIRV